MSRHGPILSSVALATLCSLSSCSDTNPLDFREDAGSDAEAGVDRERIEECKKCMTDPGAPCRKDYDLCAPFERCVTLIECAVQTGCFALPELSQRIPCVTPCLRALKVTTSDDPVVIQGLPVNACTLKAGPCGSACVPP
ncbi:MAG TPA: hypothetical protein VI072_16405 [Polyangiaceae bacterium]